MIESIDTETSKLKAEYYENKIEGLKNEFENENNKKNKEITELFEELDAENKSLKRDILAVQSELEEEKYKTQNIKETLYNINLINNNNQNESNITTNNMKNIKENTEKKLIELSASYNNNLKITQSSKASTIKFIKDILENQQQQSTVFSNIMSEFNKYIDKIEILLNENFSKEKFALIITEKYELAQEEVTFLKERIVQEKKNVIEKINSLALSNKAMHFNFMQDVLNEINTKQKNFYIEQFSIPLGNINQLLSESKSSEKRWQLKYEKLNKEFDELQNKYDMANNEKNKLLEKSANLFINTQKKDYDDLLINSQINKLVNEKNILIKENNLLVEENKGLNEQILNINNKIELELSTCNKNNEIIINQKNNMIESLNKKITELSSYNNQYSDKINESNTEIQNLKNKIQNLTDKEISYKNEIKELRKNPFIEFSSSNNIISPHFSNSDVDIEKFKILIQEKEFLENKLNILNNKYNSLVNDFNQINKQLNDSKQKISKLDLNNLDLNNKLSLSEKNQELYTAQKDLLNNIQNALKNIYQIHFGSNDTNDGENKDENLTELSILNEINKKLCLKNNNDNQQNNNINFNENFNYLEQNKNSQLYENLLLYLLNIKSLHKIELGQAITNCIENNTSTTLSNNIMNSTNNNSLLVNSKKNFDELKNEISENYSKFEERIKSSVSVDELEQLIYEIKKLYETIIDNIIQFFYNYKINVSANNILTFQMPLEKYDSLINNTNTNLGTVEISINNKIEEYKNQGNKIESALNILIQNINNFN